MKPFTAEYYDKGNDHPCYKCAPCVKHRPYDPDKCQVYTNGWKKLKKIVRVQHRVVKLWIKWNRVLESGWKQNEWCKITLMSLWMCGPMLKNSPYGSPFFLVWVENTLGSCLREPYLHEYTGHCDVIWKISQLPRIQRTLGQLAHAITGFGSPYVTTCDSTFWLF